MSGLIIENGRMASSEQRRPVVWPPIVAACICLPLLGFWNLMWVAVLVFVSAIPQPPVLPGAVVVSPSTSEYVVATTRHLVPPLVAAGLIALSSIYAGRHRPTTSVLCAVAAIVTSIASILVAIG